MEERPLRTTVLTVAPAREPPAREPPARAAE